MDITDDVLDKVKISESVYSKFNQKIASLDTEYFKRMGVVDTSKIPDEKARLGKMGTLIIYVTLPKGEFTFLCLQGEWDWI